MNFSNMALFVVYPPRRPPETGAVSVFASLMGSMAATTSRFLDDVVEADFETLSVRNEEDTDDDDNSLEGILFDEEEDYSDYGDYEDSDDDHHHDLPAPPPQFASPPRKKQRFVYDRKTHHASLWWTNHLAPHVREEYTVDPDGRVGMKFRRLFRVPFCLYLDLLLMAKDRWWQHWTPQKLDAAGKLVSNLELKLLGALFVLGNGCTHYIVSTQTNISEEVHRKFFLSWTASMASVKEEFVFLPNDEESFNRVVGEYMIRGLPGCVGSVDCVHIGWDKCPIQYHNMYKGKEGFPSIAYEVICTARKFIQSVTVGHPGSRNDKHIVRTDESVMQLLEGNGWLQSKAWKTVAGPHGQSKTFFGVYVICDGGYHRWPCMVSPVKTGVPGSSVMKWSAKVESVRKDIEGVFGILKKRFLFLKNFVNLHRQSSIDNCFTTCCILHNMLLQTDGFLDENLPAFPGGVEDRLGRKFGNAWNGQDRIWNRYEDDTVDELMEEENRRRTTVLTPHVLAIRWAKVIDALVDHHEFAGQAN